MAFVALAGLAGVAGFGGFLYFLACLPDNEIALERNADAIVVLTGGSSRVSDAIDLLAAGRGKRLLISGVHPASGTQAIARALPEHRRLIECCVDLDRSAVNTQGNAVEADRWLRDRGFRSLIVVTSNYHMPRAIAEFSHRMPQIELIPYPVVGERWRTEPWWASGATARLLVSEYVKFVVAELRARLDAFGLMPDPVEARAPPTSASATASTR